MLVKPERFTAPARHASKRAMSWDTYPPPQTTLLLLALVKTLGETSSKCTTKTAIRGAGTYRSSSRSRACSSCTCVSDTVEPISRETPSVCVHLNNWSLLLAAVVWCPHRRVWGAGSAPHCAGGSGRRPADDCRCDQCWTVDCCPAHDRTHVCGVQHPPVTLDPSRHAPPSHRRDCHSAAPPSAFSRCFNSDGEGASAQWQSRRRRAPPLVLLLQPRPAQQGEVRPSSKLLLRM